MNGNNPEYQRQPKREIAKRYMELAKTGKLPPDEQAVVLLSCAKNTPAAIRHAAHKEGWIFNANGNGFDAVLIPPPLEPSPPTANEIRQFTPDGISAATVADPLARLNIAVNEQAQMLAELVQLQRETLEVIRKAWL